MYDPVGGDIFDLSIRCLAWKTGRCTSETICFHTDFFVMLRLLVVGFAGGRIPTIAANRILLKNIAVIGVFLGSHTMREPQALPRIMGALQDLHSRGLIKPKSRPDRSIELLAHKLQSMSGSSSWTKSMKHWR